MSTEALTLSRLRDLERIEGRESLPRKMRVAPGTIENFKRGRLKRVHEFSEAVRAYFVQAISKEMRRLHHELSVAQRGGHHLDPSQVAELQALIAKAEQLIAGPD